MWYTILTEDSEAYLRTNEIRKDDITTEEFKIMNELNFETIHTKQVKVTWISPEIYNKVRLNQVTRLIKNQMTYHTKKPDFWKNINKSFSEVNLND
jgi:putative lipase involved disintegration of autophagic bodies